MSWPISTPAAIAARQIQDLRSDLSIAENVAVNEVTRGLAGAWAGGVYELLLYQAVLANELMPDKATEWLPRHASIWNVPRLLPVKAVGAGAVSGTAGLPLPAGISARSSTGALYVTTEAVELDAGGTGTVTLQAADAGTVGNLAAGSVLDLVSPIAGLSPQTITVGAEGIIGGREIEEVESWRERILAEIRDPAAAGTASDYERWARQVIGASGLVAVYPGWGGLGTVGVIVAQAGGLPATSGQLADIEAVIEANRPVTATVIVLSAQRSWINHTIALTPDTTSTRAAVTAALEAFYALAQIGVAIPLSRVSEVISAAPGEESHVLIAPTATITPNQRQIPKLGTITWVTP